MLEVTRVAKALAGRQILSDASFSCAASTVTVVRGANGSGKSTLFRVIAGILHPDRGAVHLLGQSVHHRPTIRRELGYVAETPPPLPHLTVAELLALTASLKGAGPVARARLDALGVSPLLHHTIGSLSLGQRRRASLAAALIGDPRVFVLDEPTNALARDGLGALTALVREHAAGGGAVLIATHDHAFSEQVADRVLALSEGQLRGPGADPDAPDPDAQPV